MPPYATQEHDHSHSHSPHRFNDLHQDHDLSLVEIPVRYKFVGDEDESRTDESDVPYHFTSKSVAESPYTNVEDFPKPSILERLLDCNPCTIKIANPASALFKIRFCSECGERVHKLKGGYEKEQRLETAFDEKGEESEIETKVYFHSRCCKLREDRRNHKDAGFGKVLIELEDVVQAKARKQREEEEKRARRAREESAAIVQAVRDLNDAHEETSRKDRRTQGFLERARRVLKLFSFQSCRGKKHATEESAFRGAEI